MSAPSSKRRAYPPTLTAVEVRALIDDPTVEGNMQQFLPAVVGCMSEEEADAFEQRINAMNEQVDEEDRPPSLLEHAVDRFARLLKACYP